MNRKDRMRSIKLEGDVASIAEELASKRILSKTLSELLRKEFGMSFEDDLLKSRMNDLERQSQTINEQMAELSKTINIKEMKAFNDEMIINLEDELNNLISTKREEMKKVIELTIEDLGIDPYNFEPHELMSQVSKAKGAKRKEIEIFYTERNNEIIEELSRRYEDRTKYVE
jgi:hypothetical protein